MTGVPRVTIQDRIKGRVTPTTTRSGPPPLFSHSEEKALVAHINKTARVGYGYSRLALRILATDTCVYLKKNRSLYSPSQVPVTNLLSDKWLTKFLQRNPEVTVKKPRKLEMSRARHVTEQTIIKYFEELDVILKTHNLQPHKIFNIDETGLTVDHKPLNVVGPVNEAVPAITSGEGVTTTLIGCCSAIGQSVPPFFVFKGRRLNSELLNGASPGCGCALSDSGWSNSVIFEQYLSNHLVKFLPQRERDSPVLLLYDGHKSHISGPLIEWAREQHIILFVLPAHSSHLTQPLDVGCFGPFKQAYYQECAEYMRKHVGQVITRYAICSLACTAYIKTLTPSNIMGSFRRTGIWPFNPTKIGADKVAPSTVTAPVAPSQPQSLTNVAVIEEFLQEKVVLINR